MSTILDALSAYFTDKTHTSEFASDSVGSDRLMPGKTYCQVTLWNIPPLKPKTKSGWGWRSVPVPPTAKLLFAEDGEGPQACVNMHFNNGKWAFSPGFIDGLNTEAYFLEVDETWAEVLCLLSSKQLDALLHFRPLSNFSRSGIIQEIRARVARFEYRGAFDFFSHSGDALAWLAASRWASWTRNDTPNDQRIRHLQKYIYHTVGSLMFQKLKPEALVTRLRHGQETLTPVQWKRGYIEELNRRPRKDRSLTYWYNAAKEMSSIGEDIKLFIRPPSKPEPLRAGPRGITALEANKFFLSSGFWWWRNDSVNSIFEFLNKWEESAFFYEFHARLRSETSEKPLWDWFHIPWYQLDYTQRAIIFYLCHDSDDALNSFKKKKFKGISQYPAVAKVRLDDSLQNVRSNVEFLWNQFHGFGLEDASVSHRLHSKWALLEIMDRERVVQGNSEGFNPSEAVIYGRELKKYRNMCQHAGIQPNQ